MKYTPEQTDFGCNIKGMENQDNSGDYFDEEALRGLVKIALVSGRLHAKVKEKDGGHYIIIYPIDNEGNQLPVDGRMDCLVTGPFPILVARIHLYNTVKIVDQLPGFKEVKND